MRPPLQRPTLYDIKQEQQRHDDAVHWFGEMNAFLMWWNIRDFQDNLVGRCTVCYLPHGDTAEAYGQASKSKCLSCFGTTFEGGLRAIYYRPAIWDTSDTDMEVKKRGFIDSSQGTIQVVQNLPLRKGDTVVRADGSRWDLAVPEAQEITTGFGSQMNVSDRQMRSRVRVVKEDTDSAVYLPHVDLSALELQGWVAYLPHSPHPLDDVAPDPHVAAETTTSGALLLQRGREFSITLAFFTDLSKSSPRNVSGIEYRSEFRSGPSPLATVIHQLNVDMSGAAVGLVRFWMSSVDTSGVAPSLLYWDVYEVQGGENVSVVSPYAVDVV